MNKTTFISLAVAVITCVYSVLAALGITPSLTQDMVTNIALAIITALCSLGIIVDPTTAGITDSDRAKEYQKPANELK